MIFVIITFLTALFISGVAIYYSVVGLMAIFASAAIPIAIMGGALEMGKLVAAVWLHRYWDIALWWQKAYLSFAVLILMFITSMGIFGFLSRAYIEQASGGSNLVQIVQRIDSEISFLEDEISRAEVAIGNIESRFEIRDISIQNQIDQEQQRLNIAISRFQPEIDRLSEIIRNSGNISNQIANTRIADIDSILDNLDVLIANNNVREIQRIVGIRQDGVFGPNTQRAIAEFRSAQQADRAQILQEIRETQSELSPNALEASSEISRIRRLIEQEISNSNEFIARLRLQLGQDNSDIITNTNEEQSRIIASARNQISDLLREKFQIEVEIRKLEVEVGPIKYIAELIYGNTSDSILDQSVRWVIIVIIFVFDPLAVLLLISSQHTYSYHSMKNRKKRDSSINRINKSDIINLSRKNVFEEIVVPVKSELGSVKQKKVAIRKRKSVSNANN
jgi:peptidoglycan hydrolase-like protein with peptidoglycan-binding domain